MKQNEDEIEKEMNESMKEEVKRLEDEKLVVHAKLIKYSNKKTETFYTNTSTLNLGCQPEAYLPRSCILLTLPL